MNQDEFKVSVDIAHYNAGNYIRKALDSLIRQTMNEDHFGVIIVEDKRTKPLDIIQKYESKIKHLRIVGADHSHGYPSIPRNQAIEKTRGTFIMLMDQNDNLADDTLLTFYNFSDADSDVSMANTLKAKCTAAHKVPLKMAGTLNTQSS